MKSSWGLKMLQMVLKTSENSNSRKRKADFNEVTSPNRNHKQPAEIMQIHAKGAVLQNYNPHEALFSSKDTKLTGETDTPQFVYHETAELLNDPHKLLNEIETTQTLLPETAELINNSHSDNSLDTTIDDSDIDPDFRPSKFDDSRSESEEDPDLQRIAREIEDNIALPSEILVSHKTSTSICDETVAAGPSTSANKIIPPKYKKGKAKLKECIKLGSCKLQCRSKLTYDQQLIIFNKYWQLPSYQTKALFVAGLIQIQEKKRCSTKKSSVAPRNRTHSYIYNLEVDGVKLRVCQKCFRQTLGETESFLKTVAKKKLSDTSIVDNRGKRTLVTKLTEEKVREVMEHINSYPAYESHYTRQRTAKKYLQSNLNLSLLYKMYCSSQAKPVSITKYAEIFKGMGLKFKQPKKDTCSKCDKFKIKIDMAQSEHEKAITRELQIEHHKTADLAYQQKAADKEYAKANGNVNMFTFDLQQCLATPLLTANICFYKRQLWTFNLTVHDCVTNGADCYMWYECIGKRGGNEISSCLYKHCLTQPTAVDHLIFYSDSCSGQNKNSHVAMMFTIFMQSSDHNIKIVDHKFLEPGHTHMECDVDHSIIERKKKRTNLQIHHPREWFQFIRSINRFKVTEMEQRDIFDFSLTVKQKCMWRNTNTNGARFEWAKVKWLRFTPEFGKIQYKNSLQEDEPFKLLNIVRRGINKLSIAEVPKCYQGVLPINHLKKRDLIDQLPLINSVYHNFYLQLNDGQNIPNIDPDLEDEENAAESDIDSE